MLSIREDACTHASALTHTHTRARTYEYNTTPGRYENVPNLQTKSRGVLGEPSETTHARAHTYARTCKLARPQRARPQTRVASARVATAKTNFQTQNSLENMSTFALRNSRTQLCTHTHTHTHSLMPTPALTHPPTHIRTQRRGIAGHLPRLDPTEADSGADDGAEYPSAAAGED